MALSHLLDTTPPSLLTTAARGGLRPAPDCRPRRALLHLSYSSAPLHADGVFVTHDPKPTSNVCRSKSRHNRWREHLSTTVEAHLTLGSARRQNPRLS